MRKILFNLVATFLYANIVYAEEATVTIGTSASATYAATFTSSSTHAKITASATSFSTGSGTTTSSSTYGSATAPYSVKFKPSANINTSDWNDNYSIYAQFSVSSGYTFSPTSISATIVTEAASYTYQAILTDGITTYTSSDVTSSANGVSTFSFPSLTGTALSGNVTFRIRYKSTANNKKFFVVNLPITIVGNVVASGGSSYSITYNCDGGTVCPSTVASATTLPNPLPSGLTKSGYSFAGWFTNADKTVAAVAGASIAANTTLYAKWTCAATVPGNISKGSACAGDDLTLTSAGSPASGDTWYWQASSSGTATTNSGTTYDVSEAGTYYIRSYNGTCWSAAKSVTVAAGDWTSPTISGASSVTVGNTITLTGSPSGGSWESSDETKATVNSSGVVSGVAIGNTNITYSKNGCTSNNHAVTVSAACTDPNLTITLN